MEFAYRAELELHDGSQKQVDLEIHGWASKEDLAQIKVFTLVPKSPTSGWPLVRVHIPPKAKPVWIWRTFRESPADVDAPVAEMRIYAVGYKKRGQLPFYMWVLPGGHVEAGVFEPRFADTIWANRRDLFIG